MVAQGIGSYKPLEEVQVWFGNEQKEGFAIATQETPVGIFDMSNTKEHKFTHWFQYDTGSNNWNFQGHPFFQDASSPEGAPVPSVSRIIRFVKPVLETAAFIREFVAHMRKIGWNAFVEVQWGSSIFKVTALPVSGLQSADNPDDAIRASLKSCLTDGCLPKGETWKIVQDEDAESKGDVGAHGHETSVTIYTDVVNLYFNGR